MITLGIILLAIISAWEETQQLIQRGSWKREDYRIPIWETKWDSKWKLFDSHHVAFGLFILVMILTLYFAPIKEWWMMPITFVLFWWIRNIFMHIVFKRQPLWQYLYTP
jgi:hypothetical protein